MLQARHVTSGTRETLFNAITAYRVSYPDCCRLADPKAAADLLFGSPQVDSLCEYTCEMWDVLTDVVLQEWFGLRLPRSAVPWGAICVPRSYRWLVCWDRRYARQAKDAITRKYLALERPLGSMSIFLGYGMRLADDLERERAGLEFLARQADHYQSLDDYVVIIQDRGSPRPSMDASVVCDL